MLSEDEKKAIEIVKEIKNIKFKVTSSFYSSGTVSLNIEEKEAIDTILNLITKLQKENKEKDKQIDKLNQVIDYMLDNLDTKGFGKENIYNSYKDRVEHNKQYFQLNNILKN